MSLASQPPSASWTQLSDALHRYSQSSGNVHEDLVTNALWIAIAYVPGFTESLGLPPNETWSRGGHGQADLVTDDARVQVEVKGARSKISWGKRCPSKCGEYQSQFQHIAEVAGVQLLVVAHDSAIARFTNALQEENFTPSLNYQVVSLGEAAIKLQECLRQSIPERTDAIACLFSVEG